MRNIDIQITKAQLESFTVSFEEDDKIQLAAQLALMTEGGKKVSSYGISTNYYSSNKFELPIDVIEPILKIGRELEVIVTRHCRESQAGLPEPTKDDF